ncbi:CU044_5270 family protein [Sphaerisporangium fuscum]|uniref:CU044_5270 family protein n=1 Tax=Sphaerisporangium fuscum TaxID=2835868 RepID=UPI001BDC714F|nr:CU044_5270 family protein [Sphaerisporangium fuscum]
MNDLDIVRDLRSQVRQTDERDLHGARSRLLASMVTAPRTRTVPRAVFRVAAAGALALAISAGVTVVQNLGPDATPGTGTVSVPAWVPVANAEVLAKRATAAAAGQEDVYPRADQWIYVKRDVTTSPKLPKPDVAPLGGGQTGSHYTMEMWIRGDGKERAWRGEGSETITRIRGGKDPARRYDPDYLRSLPLEPSALLERLKKDTEDVTPLRGAQAVFSQVSLILQQGAPQARLRAALYTVLSQLDGVGVDQKVRDSVGREGIGIYRDEDQGDTADPEDHTKWRREFIVDPESYALLGVRSVYLGGAKPSSPFAKLTPGEDVTSVSQVAYGIVDRAGDVP